MVDSALQQQLTQVNTEISQLEQELADLAAGRFRLTRPDGLTIEAEIEGEELRLGDPEAVIAALGYNRGATGQDRGLLGGVPDAEQVKGYLPLIAIVGGVLVLLCAILMIVPPLIRTEIPAQTGRAIPDSGGDLPPRLSQATTVPTPTPSPPSVPPTPSIIPANLRPRAPAKMAVPSRNLKWDIAKGDWRSDGGYINYIDYGLNVQYFRSLTGSDDNIVVGGDGSRPSAPLFGLRTLDTNDVISIENWGGDRFFYRLYALDGDRVEMWVTENDTWVVEPTDEATLSVIVRVGDRRMVLRGQLYRVEQKSD